MKVKLKAGKRLKIVGDHPHSGESGTYTGETTELFGTILFKVKLQDCPHKVGACFVDPRNLELRR